MKKGIKFLSLYTFSLENVNRSETEKKYLFQLIESMKNRVQEFVEKNIKIRFVGDRSAMADSLQKLCDDVEGATKDCTALQCNFLFFYGGRQEIIHAAQELQKRGEVITESSLRECLWSGNIPDPELVIRTGGHHRLSNFLLFQVAYAELEFLDVLWPDLTEQDLETILHHHMAVQKNIGK
jgi:undecaprenyl diphosphate synthase